VCRETNFLFPIRQALLREKNCPYGIFESDDMNFATPTYDKNFSEISSGLIIRHSRAEQTNEKETDRSEKVSHYWVGGEDKRGVRFFTG